MTCDVPNPKRWFLALAMVAMLGVASTPAFAASITVSMTVDNSYALFLGTHNAATSFIGSDGDWPSTETYSFDLPTDSYIYVVTASDLSVAQGFLAEFNNNTDGYTFYSNDPQWQVMATGRRDPSVGGPTFGAPYSGSATDLALLSSEILDANAGGNPSGGWVGLTEGPVNGSSPWGLRPGIDAAAHWVWYSSDGDPDPTSPGVDHDEWLVFRIAVAATPDVPVPDPTVTPVPEPATLLLTGAGLAAAIRRRRSRG